MRQHKFRVWHTEEKRWLKLQGFKVQVGELLPWEYKNAGEPTISEWVYVSGFVIQQFTGLKDKHGKEIYEGDIAESSNCLPEDTGAYEVRWDNGAFHLFWTSGHWHCGFAQEEIDALNLIVIGNIHEHPHLLTTSNSH